MNEFNEQFLLEGRELVDQAVADLLALERAPDDRPRIDSAFRAFHTLKGSAGIVDFVAMGRAVGGAEDVLSGIRAGDKPVTTSLISDCLTCLDQVAQWLDQLEATGELPADAEPEADVVLALFSQTSAREAAPEFPRTPVGSATASALEVVRAQIAMLAGIGDDGFHGRVVAAATVAANAMRHLGRDSDAAALHRALAGSEAAGAAAPLITALHAVLAETPAAEPRDAAADAAARPSSARALRVDVERIDALVRLTGEMTVVKNAIGHTASLADTGADAATLARHLKGQHAQLERLVAELQRTALSIRVVPLQQVFQRFPRLVREIGASLGKSVALVTEGEDAEADKVIVESLFEPLLHVLRNAVDHGIEPPDVRAALSKPDPAEIRISAARQGERIVIEVADDGRGVDVARVRQIAAERRVASPEALAAMDDAEATALIFAPGFSTAAQVTDLSGRGVGMDAVRVAVERLGGQVTVESRAGAGATVRFSLPFTVLVTPVMTVEAGGQVFGLPLDVIVETVRVPRNRISPVGAGQAFVLRGQTLPLCSLSGLLGGADGADSAEALVVIAAPGGRLCGLEVGRVGERMDVMLKPMEGLLAGTSGIAGSTLLGDGRVLIVLDLQELLA